MAQSDYDLSEDNLSTSVSKNKIGWGDSIRGSILLTRVVKFFCGVHAKIIGTPQEPLSLFFFLMSVI